MDKDKVQTWIDNNIGSLEGFAEFEEALEKAYPSLADRLRDIIWEYAEVEAFDEDIPDMEDLSDKYTGTFKVGIVRPKDEFEQADLDNDEVKLKKLSKDLTA